MLFRSLGFLTGASGLGALISAISLSMRRSVVGLGRVIAVTSFIFGCGLVAFGFSQSFWLSFALIMLTGFAMMQTMSSCNTILQTIVAEDKRGRIMSLYTMAIIGMMPFGSLGAGIAASRIGAPYTVMVGGVVCVAVATWFVTRLGALRRIIHPIYEELGILPVSSPDVEAGVVLRGPQD